MKCCAFNTRLSLEDCASVWTAQQPKQHCQAKASCRGEVVESKGLVGPRPEDDPPHQGPGRNNHHSEKQINNRLPTRQKPKKQTKPMLFVPPTNGRERC